MLPSISSRLPFALLACHLAFGSIALGEHGATTETGDFKSVVEDGWLTSWTNKRTGETFEFGKPDKGDAVPPVYRPGAWFIPG